MNDAEFFVTQAIAHARTLPLPQMLLFLRGFLCACGDRSEMRPVHSAYAAIFESDRQLELIVTGELRLNLSPEGGK